MGSRAADSRLVPMTTSGDLAPDRFVFAAGDTILLGRENAGVPWQVHDAVDARVVIRLRAQARSLNVAEAGAIALYKAPRQIGQLPLEPDGE